ncbi:MAG: hypothetical protein KKD90_05225 [Candidatus Omnitrophica bacterium]|nr:hypothetical protein [Candidatus Omnitrophota bacterium]
MSKRYIFVCEIGWQKTRGLSISLAQKKIRSVVLIKGMPDKQVKNMITKYEGVKNVFIPEKFFKPYMFSYIFLNIFTGRSLSLFAETKEKTYIGLENLKRLFPRIELTRLHT